jgi:hypothetical protein
MFRLVKVTTDHEGLTETVMSSERLLLDCVVSEVNNIKIQTQFPFHTFCLEAANACQPSLVQNDAEQLPRFTTKS